MHDITMLMDFGIDLTSQGDFNFTMSEVLYSSCQVTPRVCSVNWLIEIVNVYVDRARNLGVW